MRAALLLALFIPICVAAPPKAQPSNDLEQLVIAAFAYGPGPDDDDIVALHRKPNYLRVDTTTTITTGRPGFYEAEVRDCIAVVREVAVIDGQPKLQREYRVDIRRAVVLVERDGDSFIWRGGVYGSAKHLVDGQFRETELRSLAGSRGAPERRITAADAEFLLSAYTHQIKQRYCR